MSEHSNIGWTTHSWNPWLGCSKVSAGCQFCYAEVLMDHQYHRVEWGPNGTRVVTSDANWKKPLKWNREAAKSGERPRVFPSLCDPFEDREELDHWRQGFWDLIEETPNIDWLLLTKRPENVMRMVPESWRERFPSHVWMGTSVEDQQRADERIPHLLNTPAAVRFLSVEPLLGPVDLSHWFLQPIRTGHRWCDSSAWVIVGGESGPKRRDCGIDAIVNVCQQVIDAGVPLFVKQDCALKPGQQGRIPDWLWEHKQFPA